MERGGSDIAACSSAAERAAGMSGDTGAPRPGAGRPLPGGPRGPTTGRGTAPGTAVPPPCARHPGRRPTGRESRADLAAAGHPHTGTPAVPAALPARRADAGALAAAFGVDFLSWDEGDPQRRGRALASYAVPPVVEEQLAGTGWPGSGRQRGELALPGAVIALSEDRLLVHVRVRVTPFRRLTRTPACVRHSTDVLPFPAAAPAPTDPGWVGLDSYWYELLVPMREVADQWRVDIGAVIVGAAAAAGCRGAGWFHRDRAIPRLPPRPTRRGAVGEPTAGPRRRDSWADVAPWQSAAPATTGTTLRRSRCR